MVLITLFLAGGLWKHLELWARKVIEYSEVNGLLYGSLEKQMLKEMQMMETGFVGFQREG